MCTVTASHGVTGSRGHGHASYSHAPATRAMPCHARANRSKPPPCSHLPPPTLQTPRSCPPCSARHASPSPPTPHPPPRLPHHTLTSVAISLSPTHLPTLPTPPHLPLPVLLALCLFLADAPVTASRSVDCSSSARERDRFFTLRGGMVLVLALVRCWVLGAVCCLCASPRHTASRARGERARRGGAGSRMLVAGEAVDEQAAECVR